MLRVGDPLTVNNHRYTVAGRMFINGYGQRCPIIGNEYLWLIRQVNKKWEGMTYLVQGFPRVYPNIKLRG
jgi:hypothetical protein